MYGFIGFLQSKLVTHNNNYEFIQRFSSYLNKLLVEKNEEVRGKIQCCR
jgi:hypothetical protein